MAKYVFSLLLLYVISSNAQQITVKDSVLNTPIPFATISFGNGLGTFANEEGSFSFTKEKYPDVDSLYISAMGFYEKGIKLKTTTTTVYLKPKVSELDEVIVTATKQGKFKTKKQKANTHNDIFACWLPTVESEVAVLFHPVDNKTTQISKLYLPIYAEANYKTKGKGNYATIFRIQFYNNKNGTPGAQIKYTDVIFPISEKQDKIFELDITPSQIFIPKNGIFVSLQVLGYADDYGKLIDAKKYREIKTSRGIQKIATSFRPLLPFVKGEATQKTYVRRIFFNNKRWQILDNNYNKNSKLVQLGTINYSMGALFKVYQN